MNLEVLMHLTAYTLSVVTIGALIHGNIRLNKERNEAVRVAHRELWGRLQYEAWAQQIAHQLLDERRRRREAEAKNQGS